MAKLSDRVIGNPQSDVFVKRAGDTMSGTLAGVDFTVSNLTPTANNELASKFYVDSQGGSSWGSITGVLANQTDLQSALDDKLSLTGGNLTGDVGGTRFFASSGTPTVATELTTKQYVDNSSGGSSWGAITGTLSNQTDLQSALDDKLSLTGGTLTGDLAGTKVVVSSLTPTVAGELATKQYVDSVGDSKLPLAGGNLTGDVGGTRFFASSATPTVATELATKQYVDASGGGGAFLPLTGGTLTGALEVNNSSPITSKPTITIKDTQKTVATGNYALFEFRDSNDYQFFKIEKNGPLVVEGVAISTTVNGTLSLSGKGKSLGVANSFTPGWSTGNPFYIGRADGGNSPYLRVQSTPNYSVYLLTVSNQGVLGMSASLGGGRVIMGTNSTALHHPSGATSLERIKTTSAGVTVTGTVFTTNIVPTSPNELTSKSYVDAATGGGGAYLPLSGGTLTGDLIGTKFFSFTAPTVNSELTNKLYVDTAIAAGGGGAAWGGITGTLSAQTDLQAALDGKFSVAGGNLTGDVGGTRFFASSGNPTVATELSTKAYVDQEVAGGGIDTTSDITWFNSTSNSPFLKVRATGGGIGLFSSGNQGQLLAIDPTGGLRTVGVKVIYNGETRLCFAGLDKLETKTDGVAIGGKVTVSSLNLMPTETAELTTKAYVDQEVAAGGGGAAWGGITGTLSAQTDLQSALDGKLSLTGGTVTGNFIIDSDTANIRLIDGSDQVRIIHSGSSTSFKTYFNGTASQNAITFQRSGGANLYFSDALKLKTTTDGIEVDGIVSLGAGSPSWRKGTGDPTGVVGAPVGSIWSRTDGGVGTTLYVKESGGGGTSGWVAK